MGHSDRHDRCHKALKKQINEDVHLFNDHASRFSFTILEHVVYLV